MSTVILIHLEVAVLVVLIPKTCLTFQVPLTRQHTNSRSATQTIKDDKHQHSHSSRSCNLAPRIVQCGCYVTQISSSRTTTKWRSLVSNHDPGH
ncbi:hypothetical protein KC19_4G255000 [Ceratodon purpureus]|uniref:Secreted protein n=1 Tax=Ceratodon purpureus TaxID=3225 RepID=A0A8T0IEN6_CERPU|nr:hypothetical protein KC19_4G255000 [Ceratodon purpureus]